MTLEADGIIDIWEIETGRVVAQYEGLEFHEAMLSIPDMTARIAELEAALHDTTAQLATATETVARLEADNRRLRHLDAMPVDALARYWKNSGVPAFGIGYESDEYEADYDAIVGWFNLLGYTDGAA